MRVLDAVAETPLEYATVYNKRNGKATITNQHGFFTLNELLPGDTLVVSYVGYSTFKSVVSEVLKTNFILLEPRSELVDEAVVIGSTGDLYELFAKSRLSFDDNQKTAKTYFSLESRTLGKRVELLECYYNGIYSTYNVDALLLKNGRLALEKYANKYFISHESSDAMCMHMLFVPNDRFPESPFGMNKRKLKSIYELNLESGFETEDGREALVVRFEPKKEKRKHFAGRAWLDAESQQLLKIELEIKEAGIHPFTPIFLEDEVELVNMNITKTFKEMEKRMFVESINFEYQVHYLHTDGRTDVIDTKAVLYAYDYNDRFLLPIYSHGRPRDNDYRKINSIPYNHLFWKNFDEFKINDIRTRNQQFINSTKSITNQTLFDQRAAQKRSILPNPLHHWAHQRFIFNNRPSPRMWPNRHSDIAQIFLDVNQFEDSLQIVTSTLIDAREVVVRNNGKFTDKLNIYFNLYFDLVELERRKLQKTLEENCSSQEEVVSRFQQLWQDIDKRLKDFEHETNRGEYMSGLKKYNELIKKELGVDNFLFFGLKMDGE
ncbi:carboxypeptidase-like regulatory domain-containing protein [Halocola ammonii]